jgi:CRP-like cAMP-binding protein
MSEWSEGAEILEVLLQAGGDKIRREEYQDGEVIIREGSKDRDLFFLEQGSIVIEKGERTSGGDRPTILVATSSDQDAWLPFGEMAYYSEGARTATVRSSGRSTVLRLKPECLSYLFAHAPKATEQLFISLVGKLRRTTEALRSFDQSSLLSPQQRVISKEETLFPEGAPADRLFQCLSGSVRLGGTPSRRIHGTDGPEGFIDPTPYFLKGTHRVAAVAAPGTILLIYESGQRDNVIRNFPELVRLMLRDKEPPTTPPVQRHV